MATMVRRASWLVAAAALAAGCQGGSTTTTTLVEHEQNGVRTTVVLDEGDVSASVTAIFTPTDDGWHLYSKDLPADGISGVGRPTRVAVSGGLVMTGPASTDSVPFDLTVAAVDEPLSIYEDGPVRLQVPVVRNRDSAGDVEVTIGYMACATDGGCRAPVDHMVTVSLDAAP